MKNQRSWREQGEDPDYRFSLANERTFLAWIRTALALLAGAVLLRHSSPPPTDTAVHGATLLLALLASILSLFAYRHWRKNEHAMRLKATLPQSPSLVVVALGVTLSAWIVLALLVVR